ncbi:MAG: 5'/3'-nucleotidase SurE [Bacteroidetes bacterium]|nr:5'/3'-nucleotidase SurE [Bacteroidota bacterium]
MEIKKEKTILVSNDDGIDSAGIHSLVKALSELANVIVVAPETQQSAVGHAITVHRPLRVKEYKRDEKFFGYAVDGTPADCIKLAAHHLLEKKPDLIVSGINHGSNTAISVIYSGTVSAATEGTILGIPSFAISLTSFDTTADFSTAADFSKQLSRLVLEKGLPKGTLLNVNVPPLQKKDIKKVVITRQGKSFWDNEFESRRDPDNREYFWLKGELIELDNEEDSDQKVILDGNISITPIQYDLTNNTFLKQLRDWKIEI